MLETLKVQKQEGLLGLLELYAADTRPGKIDLGIGVYRDETGATPVLASVKEAERLIWERQGSKSYQGLEGDRDFLTAFGALLFGEAAGDMARLQTIGGSGALRLACDLLHDAGARRIWVGLPTWPNHQAIIRAGRLKVVEYPYVDMETGRVDFDRVRATLGGMEAGDVVLLHGCCHNPTGAGLSRAQWREIAGILAERRAVPLIDLAYLGFGERVEGDLDGVRAVLDVVPEAFVAASCSKCFALYRDRIGALFVKTAPAQREMVQSGLESLARTAYSMPAAHGAAIVATILGDAALRERWLGELDGMRRRIAGLRAALASRLAPVLPGTAAVAEQEGMFSTLPVTRDEVARLREAHAVYMADTGRINIAGLQLADVPRFADAIAAVRRG
ncbi:aromatic amino acid transaminase [Roseomonas chloroacetimidivorans]|uniref:aromatic amino acid transaminase n=1 Tax=Roseomonas chloroacetimidivorans TaxID=1766656 RepID=UPI003C76E993